MDKHIQIFEKIEITIQQVCNDFTLKCLFGFAYVTYSFLFDNLQTQSLFAILTLIVIDFITGIWAAKVSGEVISSAKVFRSVVKMIIYFMFISAAHLMETTTPLLSVADELIISFLAVTELISVIENVGKMGFAIPKKFLNKLQEFRDSK